MIHDHTSLERPFIPDAVLPVQYWHRRKLDEPWQRLMMAVLVDGIRCYQTNHAATSAERRLLFGEAAEWLFAASDSGLFSCNTICHAIGIDPEYLRDGLKRWRKKQHEELRAIDNNDRVMRTSVRSQRRPKTGGALARPSLEYQRRAIETGRSLQESGEPASVA